LSKLLKKSKYLQVIESGKCPFVLVYSSLFGFPQIMDENGLKLLSEFSNGNDVDEVIIKNYYDGIEEQIGELERIYFLLPSELDERKLLKDIIYDIHLPKIEKGSNIEYLSLILSEECNFGCQYCISNSMICASDRKENKVKLMKQEMAKRAIDRFFKVLKDHGKKEAYINFGGGEPLLNWSIMIGVIEYCKKAYAKDFTIVFSVNTNGSLIDEYKAKKMKEHNVKIAISLDGLEAANDKVRVYKTGSGTFKSIICAMDIFRKIEYDITGFSTTVNERNFHHIDEKIVDFALERKLREIRIDLDVIHMLNIPISEAIQKLLKIKRYGMEKGISITGFWERPTENLNFSIVEKHTGFCGGIVGKSMCVSPSGGIYICGYSATEYANINNEAEINSKNYFDIISGRLIRQRQSCENCPIEGQCVGGCFITEEFSRLSDDNALRYNCELYRLITTQLLKDNLNEVLLSSGMTTEKTEGDNLE
jgi:uncharacterized protein